MSNKIINILGFLLIAVFLSPLVTSAAIGVTWTATSTTPGYISPTLINGYAPGIGVTGNSNLNMGLNSTTGFGSSTPYADLSIHANDGEVNRILFAIASSTATATTTLVVVDNMGDMGIGTTSPFANLSIHANLGTTNFNHFAIGSTTPTGTINTNFSVDNIGTVHIKGGGSAYTNIGQFTGGSSFGGIGFGTTPGIVSATGYSMIGDGANTYLNAPAGGSMYFRQGNAEKMFLNSSGNFGIGTTSPLAKLSIQANAGENNPYLFAIGSSTGAYATTTLFSVNNVGSVSIGTSSVPANTLTFQGFGTGMAAISLASSISGPVIKTLSGSNNSTLYLSPANGGTRLFDTQNGTLAESLDIWNGSTRTINLASNGASYFNGGFFGIGSTTPYANLGINANNGSTNTTLFAIGSSTQTATTTLFTVDNTGNVVTPGTVSLGSGAAGANLVVNGGTLRVFRAAVGDGSINVMSGGINLTSTGFLALNSNSIERARFLSTGQYGIGTTTPYALSSIHANNGSTNTTLFAIASSTQTATTTLMSVDNMGNVTSGNSTTASTTRTFIGKWQMDTYNTAGTEICAFFVGTTLSASTGACNQ